MKSKRGGLSTIKIRDLRSLEKAIYEVSERLGSGFPLWRGHANMHWLLQPEVFRKNVHGHYDEITLIRYFVAQAPSRSTRYPNKDDRRGAGTIAKHEIPEQG
jgi:hypothetical protein